MEKGIFKKNTQSEKKVLGTEELFEELLNDYLSMADKLNILMDVKRKVITIEDFQADVNAHMKKYYDLSAVDTESVLKLFEQYILGYFRLTPLIDDLDITDIHCLGYDNIRVKKKGKREGTTVKFKSPQEYKQFVDGIGTKNHVDFSVLNAIQRFSDVHSSKDFLLRFTVTMPLINTYGEPYVHIRKTLKDFPEMNDLVEADMLSAEWAEELTKRFRSGSTLICGGNSSGKTTILNALKETLPEDMAVMVIQQAVELLTKHHPDMRFMESLPASGESKVSYDLRHISIAALTMDVDFFIVGEIKGGEAAYLLNAAYSGQLCAGTLHAPSADKAADKIVDYCLQGNPSNVYKKEELMKMLACFKNVIYMDNYKFQQLYEITGWNEKRGELEYKKIYDRGDKCDNGRNI